MTVPEFLPVLSAGAHDSPKSGACVMEYVSLLAGEPWSDSPSCTHPVLAATARRVNDALPDSDRQQLVPLIGRLFGTAPTGTDHDRKVLSVRLAVWSARQVLHLVREQDRAVCITAITTAEAWCDGRAATQECRTAAADATTADATTADATTAAADATYAAATYAAAAATYAAADATYAADATTAAAADATIAAAIAATYAYAYATTDAATDAAYAATEAAYAATAATAATAAGRIGFLTGLLDEYDRLTGRTATPLAAEQWQQLVEATA